MKLFQVRIGPHTVHVGAVDGQEAFGAAMRWLLITTGIPPKDLKGMHVSVEAAGEIPVDFDPNTGWRN